MKVELKVINSILSEMDSCYIREGYGGMLRVGLGKKIPFKSPDLKGKFHGEWEIITRNVAWRVVKDNELVCGSDEYAEESNDKLYTLSMERLENISQPSPFDIHISFSNDMQVQYFSNSSLEPKVVILGPQGIIYELNNSGWERVDTDEDRSNLNEMDRILHLYSEECLERWAKLIPQNETEYQCDDCFYYRNIDGFFSTLDYGVCTNKVSINDRRLVNISSGCDKHKRLSDLMEV